MFTYLLTYELSPSRWWQNPQASVHSYHGDKTCRHRYTVTMVTKRDVVTKCAATCVSFRWEISIHTVTMVTKRAATCVSFRCVSFRWAKTIQTDAGAAMRPSSQKRWYVQHCRKWLIGETDSAIKTHSTEKQQSPRSCKCSLHRWLSQPRRIMDGRALLLSKIVSWHTSR